MKEVDVLQRNEILLISLNPDWSLSIKIGLWVGVIFVSIIITYFIWRWRNGHAVWKDFEIDQTEIGVGTGKIKLKPNTTDRQVAYAIWVELSTRKIGLPIDFDHDVIAEIYDSWYTFFSITRDLIKSIPVNKLRHDSTQKIVQLSIEVLNTGIRPHLTEWQARFRRWYENEINKSNNDIVIDPQDIQRNFPKYTELTADMMRVNAHLIKYRETMHHLVLPD
jgi:hypothetical protein